MMLMPVLAMAFTQWLPIIWLAQLLLASWALVALFRNARSFEAREGIWAIFIVIVPLAGPLTFLVYQKLTAPKYPVW